MWQKAISAVSGGGAQVEEGEISIASSDGTVTFSFSPSVVAFYTTNNAKLYGIWTSDFDSGTKQLVGLENGTWSDVIAIDGTGANGAIKSISGNTFVFGQANAGYGNNLKYYAIE